MSIFGWKSVAHNYGWKGFLKDSILPVIISSALCITMHRMGKDSYIQLKHLVDIGISVIPAMVALILTAYTIMLSFFIGDKFSEIKKNEKGKRLIKELNSGFAACLFVSTFAIIIMIVVSCVANLNFEVYNPDIINYPIYFIVCYLLFYSVSILIGIVIDIFNCGQTTLLDDDSNE